MRAFKNEMNGCFSHVTVTWLQNAVRAGQCCWQWRSSADTGECCCCGWPEQQRNWQCSWKPTQYWFVYRRICLVCIFSTAL